MTKDNTLFTRIPTRQNVKVLYQNLGGRWYAFADVNGEVYYSPLDFIQPAQPAAFSFTEEDEAEKRRAASEERLPPPCRPSNLFHR